MKQLELSVFLTLVALVFGGHYLFRSTRPVRSHRATTYVPEASLSDRKSWDAWKTTVGNAVSTEAYVKQAPSSMRAVPSKSQTIAPRNSSSSEPQPEVNLEQMRFSSLPMASEQEEGSFASSIVLASPSALPSAQNDRTETQSALIDDPNFLPNLFSLGMFSEEEDKGLELSESRQTLPESTLSGSSNVERTVVSVPVALQAEVSELPTTLDRTIESSNSFWVDRVLWMSLLATFAAGSIGLAKYCLPKLQDRKQASLHSPPSVQ